MCVCALYIRANELAAVEAGHLVVKLAAVLDTKHTIASGQHGVVVGALGKRKSRHIRELVRSHRRRNAVCENQEENGETSVMRPQEHPR